MGLDGTKCYKTGNFMKGLKKTQYSRLFTKFFQKQLSLSHLDYFSMNKEKTGPWMKNLANFWNEIEMVPPELVLNYKKFEKVFAG